MNDSQATRSALIVLLRAQRNGMGPAEKAKRKKPVRWLYPWATENHYRRLYQEWVKPVRVFVHEFLEKHQESVLRGDAANAVIRQDAVAGESFALMVRSLNGWVNAYISDDEQKKLRSPIYMGLGDVSQSAFNFNGGQYNKSVKSALGVNFPSDESWWPDARKQWQDTNYEVIRSDIRKYISDINSTTEQAVTNGWSVKMLSEQIMALDSKITKSRAAFIARDQIGKLNGIITQKRMQDIGLTMYEWSSSSDERVRESHAIMDGKLCRWDDATVYSEDGGKTWKPRPSGAVLMHPGMDYQCRCCALAWFNELIDEADGVESENIFYGSADNMPKEKALKTTKKIGTITKGDAMTFEEADGNRPNPNFLLGGGYRENCQASVAVFEARLKGFNIQAKAFDENNKYFKKLMRNPAKAFIDPVTRKHPKWLERESFSSWEKGFEYVDKTVEANQRYAMRMKWKNGGGHVITAIRSDDKNLFFYDPQSGFIYEDEDIEWLFKNIDFSDTSYQPELLYLNPLQFDENVLQYVVEAANG